MIKKLRKFENKLIDFITNNIEIFFIGILLILSVFVRYKLLNYESPDYYVYLKNWFIKLKESGGIRGLGTYTGNYNTPYVFILSLLTYLPINSLYSIKIVSIIFDYILAVLSAIFVYKLFPNEKEKKKYAVIALVTMLFLPTIIVNGAFWAQCDIIYTTFIVLSLYFMLKNKYTLSFIMFGIAFSFKLQAIFILPAYLILYIKEKKFSIMEFFIIPLTYIVLSTPALIMGKTIKDIFLVYLNQTSAYHTSLALNLPNFYKIINFDVNYFGSFAVVFCIFLLAILAYFIIKSNMKFNSKSIFLLTIVSVLICSYFLPYMHERYMFIVDILSILYALVYKDKIKNAALIQLISLNAYFTFLSSGSYVPTWVCAVVLLYVICDYTKDLFKNTEKTIG